MPFRAGQLANFVHVWRGITSDLFILDAISHCYIEFDIDPLASFGGFRPHTAYTDTEQIIIDDEISKFLQKKVSSYEKGQVTSPIFTRPKKDGSHRVIFNLNKLNESVSHHHTILSRWL